MYTLCQELTDATLDVAFYAVASKSAALRAARACSIISDEDVHRIIVNDRDGQTVAVFETGHQIKLR